MEYTKVKMVLDGVIFNKFKIKNLVKKEDLTLTRIRPLGGNVSKLDLMREAMVCGSKEEEMQEFIAKAVWLKQIPKENNSTN